MVQEGNKTAILRAIEHWNNQGTRDRYFDLYDENVATYGFAPGLPPGVEGLKHFYAALWAAFPDAKVTIEEMVAEGEKVAVRYTFTGTHRGEFLGIPATGNQVHSPGMTILRMSGGKCVERHNLTDTLAIMQQIGAIPAR
jgi:steroid delta-isomerase-like uncharacterized protein